jgi:curved DNA-binding protein CbpA
VSTRDPYEVLGVPRTASTRQIRLAYVDRARRAHPDLVGQRGTEVMRALNEAWALLKDPDLRSEFDAAAAAARAVSVERHGTADGAGRIDTTRPFWTGAAGPPPGRPHGSVLDFGIFEGWSLGEIARKDRGYLVWLRERPEGRPFVAEITRLLGPIGEETPPARKGRKR